MYIVSTDIQRKEGPILLWVSCPLQPTGVPFSCSTQFFPVVRDPRDPRELSFKGAPGDGEWQVARWTWSLRRRSLQRGRQWVGSQASFPCCPTRMRRTLKPANYLTARAAQSRHGQASETHT